MKTIGEHQAFITSRLQAACDNDPALQAKVIGFYQRFCQCDWGDTCAEDWAMNDEELSNRDGRVLALYKTEPENLFISMTFDEPSINADVVTIMFASDY